MVVLPVVPVEKGNTEGTGVFDGTKTGRKLRSILEGLELRFRIWVVIARMGTTMGLRDPQIGQEKGHRLGGHG
jgi:hypothetical protein